MAIDVTSINWLKENLVKKDIKQWTGSGVTPDPDGITIEPGGYLENIIDRYVEKIINETPTMVKAVLSSSLYIKVGVDILTDIDSLSDYNSGINIGIKELYITEEDEEFNKTRFRELVITQGGISMLNGYRHTVHLMSMLEKPLDSLKVKITNTSDIPIKFRWIGIYASQDVGTYQYSQIQQESKIQYGTYIEPRLDDPLNPELGRIWLRIDL